VGAAATAQVRTLSPEDDLFAAVAAFEEGKVRRVPVVSGGALIGLVTLRDIEEALWRLRATTRRTVDFVPGAAFIPADRR
jgi:CBS domain-containing protein